MTSKKIPAFNDWPNDIGFTTHEEQSEPVDLEVIGTIPAYVSGTLYRASTAGNSIPLSETTSLPLSHWFDGLATVHRFTISPPSGTLAAAKITHTSRLTSSGILTRVRRTGSLSGFTFGQKHDPCESLYAKFKSAFFSANSALATADERDDEEVNSCMNVGVTISTSFPNPHAAGKIVVKTDAAVMQLLTGESLKPERYLLQRDLHSSLRGPLSAAHARTDPLTGDLYNYNLDMHPRNSGYRVFRTAKDTGATEILATIKDAAPAYIHSFWMSENYLILCIWNSRFSWRGAKCVWEKNLVDAIADWDPQGKSFFYVIDRKGGKGIIAKFVDAVPFFAFHTIGAWEEGEEDLVLEALSYDNLDVIKKFYYENILSTNLEKAHSWLGRGRTALSRWRLPSILKTNGHVLPAIRESTLAKEWGMELPTINPLFVHRKNRYIYATTSTSSSSFMDGLVKFDTKTNTAKHWQVHAHTPGEAIFIPNPAGSAEDDGVLLSVVLDGLSGRSYLLVLDASDMSELARAQTKAVVGFGFHGKWEGEGGGGVEY
ncbi:carotenoid oxygenase [Choiromyces venosus 120613-1]|uniref:Carotenoid oxygenase n=1 Tax=Choiromyces venosus 120613-1 TaxID=1336337 RepID=A0A3N4IVQ9_9PEZI|nr:carotenoid oxygenase [Choiromyces venosus 120613-1]